VTCRLLPRPPQQPASTLTRRASPKTGPLQPNPPITSSQDGLTRHDLDVALLIAESEPITGLPDWPADYPIRPEAAQQLPPEFRLRRVETMSAAHAAAVAALSARLALLKVGSVASLSFQLVPSDTIAVDGLDTPTKRTPTRKPKP